MSLVTTSIGLSSVATAIVPSSRVAGASLYDPVPVAMFNGGGQPVYWGGSDMTTANIGIQVAALGTQMWQLMASDAVFGITTGGAVTVVVVYGRQHGAA